MTSLQIADHDIPDCTGKIVLISGGCSGIGFSAGKLFAAHGARVLLLDRNPPAEPLNSSRLEYFPCDVTSWSDLLAAFQHAGRVDVAVANAGVSEEADYFADTFDEAGVLVEPAYGVLDVNLRGVLNFTKLAISSMRRLHVSGSIVITSSATAYSPEHSLPVYSAAKLALVGLIRALRSSLPKDDITINAVAPAATITNLLPLHLANPIIAAGLPVSSSDFVGLAVVYSAVASEPRKVEPYGKDSDDWVGTPGRWNGRVILTLGDRYTELEGPLAALREKWFGEENNRLTRQQQIATDFRLD
ncbi:hypothetical protein N7523_000485 [Penicillium sp. IBT 18751x]|nr:hypothetical protein N7523_000485 [Penicillium sp. IBT 18751x]